MADEEDEVPSRHEIETQLQRMLDDDVFRSHPKQAEVFACIVRSQLNREEVTEKSIRAEIFPDPPYEPSGNHVRVTVTYVRNRIAEYYEGAGIDDLVIIGLPSRKERKLPPGDAYRPTFTYNPRSVANEQCRRGHHHIHELSSRPYLDLALAAFEEAINAEPAYGPAHLGVAEAQLLKAFFTCEIPPGEFLAAAEESAREALRFNENLSQAHSILGAVHLCRGDKERADAAFDQARRIAHDEAWNSPWKAVRMMADAHYFPAEEILMNPATFALEIMERRAKNRPGDAFAKCLLGLFLHVARRRSGVDIALVNAAADSDRHNWLMHVVNELNEIALLGNRRDGMLKRGEAPYNMPYEITYMAILEDDRFLTPCCPGLAVVFAASRGFDAEARDLLGRMESAYGPYIRPFQLALGYLALGDHQRALNELAKAAEEHDPYLVWFHLWPLFDPLRNYPEFGDVMDRFWVE